MFEVKGSSRKGRTFCFTSKHSRTLFYKDQYGRRLAASRTVRSAPGSIKAGGFCYIQTQKIQEEKKMKKLGISRTRELLKRELGVSAANLKMPPMMNQNPKYPWYELRAGNLLVELGSTVELDNIMIRLSTSFNDGRGGINRYFYGDTLEEAPEFIESDRWEEIMEKAESCEYSRETMQRNLICLEKDARKACWKHTETVRFRSVAADQCAQAARQSLDEHLELGE
ncbi:hypothetical protein OBV_34080 [Oscillibacter valericigenes Sjm18-20]|nr:hypothetical protein OBV_34080 [Oscillibacter valericigenes Sjm18-20]